jgi:3-deoxy-D-manno-octulosonic-acid transferase
MLLYHSVIFLYTLSVHIASLFKTKAKLWVNGRKNWKQNLENSVAKFGGEPRVWIHCASLGEFEQARPIIEGIKKTFPSYRIVLSFFSPSGFEPQKNYEYADLVVYLPADTRSNAAAFIDRLRPKAVIFIKYEFWLNYLFELDRKKIPVYLASAVIKPHQPFFKWYGGNFRRALKTYRKILVQDPASLQLLQSLNVNSGVVCGDTRTDRVLAIKEHSLPLHEIRNLIGESKNLIAGSSWEKDEEILIRVYPQLKKQFPLLKLVLVPHETDQKNIDRLCGDLEKAGLSYSLYTSIKEGKDILVINTIGLLSSIYKFGDIAYVGGGFNSGIHNILEPAVYGLPLIFGPNHKKFNEAADLLRIGGAVEINSEEALLKTIENYLKNPVAFEKAAKASEQYVNANKGAARKIIEQLDL